MGVWSMAAKAVLDARKARSLAQIKADALRDATAIKMQGQVALAEAKKGIAPNSIQHVNENLGLIHTALQHQNDILMDILNHLLGG